MEAIKVKGKVVFVGQTQVVGEKEFKKREIVLELDGNPNYPDEVAFEATKDKCDELNGISYLIESYAYVFYVYHYALFKIDCATVTWCDCDIA